MSAATPLSDQRDTSDARDRQHLAITDGEVNFLWSFIQGSIVIPETWKALLRAYGFCERHAWVHLSVEMSFRRRHFLGPVILYRALIEKSVQAVQGRQHLHSPMRRRLRSAGPCFLCAMDINNVAAGVSSRARLDRGRDSGGLHAFAGDLALLWRPRVCGVCASETCEAAASRRCRRHLITDMTARRPIDISWQRSTLRELSRHLARYEESFVAGADAPSDQDRAALISAIGWCSGWRPLLALSSKVAA